MHAGVFYFTLGNIPSVNRSSLKVIYLLAVVKSKVIDEYGFHSVLKKFIADINHLEVCVINKCMHACACILHAYMYILCRLLVLRLQCLAET